jgi:hypothetical protein
MRREAMRHLVCVDRCDQGVVFMVPAIVNVGEPDLEAKSFTLEPHG